MSLIADGLLIATCLTAAIYCYVLGGRLKRFSSTEEGVGKQVRDLNLALEETRAALKEAQSGAAATADALSAEMARAKKLSAELQAVAADMQTRIDNVAAAAPRVAESHVEPVETAAAAPIEEPKLEAVKHASPSAAPITAVPEEDDTDIEELDLDAVLEAAPGEQQLGFLPDVSESDEGGPNDSEDDGKLRAATIDMSPEAVVEAEDDASGPAAEPSEKLMKVERMAL
ncbi:MAG: hypothetical protein AAF674_15870 [Pseudomonadota bacterium]